MRIQGKFGKKPLLLLAANLLMVGGTIAILVSGWALLDGTLYQYAQKVQFAAEVAGGAPGIAREIHPVARPQPELTSQLLPNLAKMLGPDPLVIGELEVPRVGLSVMVREGMDPATLRRAVGHVPSTALPGELGNVVILGHRDTFFRDLRGVEKGDIVQITTTQDRFTYAIESIQVVEPDSIILTAPTSGTVVTLITCFPFNYVGPAPRRFVARARLRERFR